MDKEQKDTLRDTEPVQRPRSGKEYMEGRSENWVDLSELAQAEDELHRLKEEAGMEEKGSLPKRLIERYYRWKDERIRHPVKKKVYLILNGLLGWCGMHRFYERRWGLGLFYLALSWTGFPAILCVTDFLTVLPMKADENGMLLI